jgi:hypothetical protein
MNRSSLTCKAWKVTVHTADGTDSAYVYAPNKMFARWNAEDKLGELYWLRCDVHKVTVSLWRGSMESRS